MNRVTCDPEVVRDARNLAHHMRDVAGTEEADATGGKARERVQPYIVSDTNDTGAMTNDVLRLAAELMAIDSTSGQEGELMAHVSLMLESRGWRVTRIPVT